MSPSLPDPLPDCPAVPSDPRQTPRRRIYLMRHGAVDYFLEDGTPVPPDTVPLNATGRDQADAAGRAFAAAGVRFDRVVVSGLPRTLETAARVMAASGHALEPQVVPALEEIRGGRITDIPADQVEAAFTGAFTRTSTDTAEVMATRFLGGESVGELLDRVLPAFRAHLNDPGWTCSLVVLHGAVNRALLSWALAGAPAFFGRMEQLPACVNILDARDEDVVVRAVNLWPAQWLQQDERMTTMEKMLAQYLRPKYRAPQNPPPPVG